MMRKACDTQDKADYYRGRALSAESNHAISGDDPDRIEKLREKLEQDAAAPRWLVTIRGTGYMFTQRRNVNEV